MSRRVQCYRRCRRRRRRCRCRRQRRYNTLTVAEFERNQGVILLFQPESVQI